MSRRLLCLLAAGAAACAPAKNAADSTQALAVDTIKPVVVALPDTTRRDSTAPRPVSTKTVSTKQPTVARDTAHLGRDSVIITNPRDPRRQLPTVPPKKPE